MNKLSAKLTHLSRILSDLAYHDGDSLGKQLNITRSAVWKYIKKLQEYEIKIDSGKNKGYAYREPLILLDKEYIAKELENPNIEIEILESVDSTNDYLKKNLSSNKRKICLAETQTNGKGRMARNWHAPFGQNIYMSYAYIFKKDISELAGLSLVISIAMHRAIKEIVPNSEIMLKWPNDGIYQNSKIMGNLIELISEANGESTAIIGMGINVNMMHANDISQKWSSLRIINNTYVDRNLLCVALIHNLNASLEQFSKYGLREFINQWTKLDYLYNQQISLNEGEISGIAKGINEQGNLLLELSDGRIRAFSSGDTSIKKPVVK